MLKVCIFFGASSGSFGERIHVPHAVDVLRPQNVVDADDVLVVEAQQDLDFPQRALAIGLVLEWADLLDGDALVGRVIQGRTGRRGSEGEHRAGLMLHTA